MNLLRPIQPAGKAAFLSTGPKAGHPEGGSSGRARRGANAGISRVTVMGQGLKGRFLHLVGVNW